jgi:putative DNA primase/helicase
VVAEEEGSSNGGPDDSGASDGAKTVGKSRKSTPARRAVRETPVNAIEASRRRRKDRTGAIPPAEAAETPSAAASTAKPSNLRRADSDPWTVPQSVRDRFVQEGNRFYFPDGAPAFKDLGRRLTTASENTRLVHSLIEIAQSRGWTEVTVTGTDRFRQEAWRQARLAGLSVRGYRPNEEERALVIRALGRNLPQPTERVDSVSLEGVSAAPTAPAAALAIPEGPAPTHQAERVAGRLLDFGKDSYRHDPDREPSYFVRLQTREGVREIWGKDIERAVAKSLTQPKLGDEVVLQRTGRDAVTVRRQARDDSGQPTERPVETFRNRWVIEKQEFFEQRAGAAQVVRDAAIGARQATRAHPELAGTYLTLKAAELASQALRDSQDRRRFVAQVRGVLAEDIEQGEPLQPVRLRERGPPLRQRSAAQQTRTEPTR